MFHQVEGLHIDTNINMGHLKGCLNYFIKEFFEVEKIKMRFRPSHFPFTEPSAEVDIGYRMENNKIIIGEGDKWLEILGCGMVDPEVFNNVGYDSKIWHGYAFGMGVERIAMLKHNIDDIRLFYGNFQNYPDKNISVDWCKENNFSWEIEHDIFICKKK